MTNNRNLYIAMTSREPDEDELYLLEKGLFNLAVYSALKEKQKTDDLRTIEKMAELAANKYLSNENRFYRFLQKWGIFNCFN